MSPKTVSSPFQALEEEAYHAFREWPVWLALRERQLAAHLQSDRPAVRASGAATPGAGSAQQRGDTPLDTRGA